MEKSSHPDSTSLDFDSDSRKGDLPVYGTDCSPARNMLQLANLSRLAFKCRAKLLKKPKLVKRFHPKWNQNVGYSTNALLTFNTWMRDTDMWVHDQNFNNLEVIQLIKECTMY